MKRGPANAGPLSLYFRYSAIPAIGELALQCPLWIGQKPAEQKVATSDRLAPQATNRIDFLPPIPGHEASLSNDASTVWLAFSTSRTAARGGPVFHGRLHGALAVIHLRGHVSIAKLAIRFKLVADAPSRACTAMP
jgi:hypothetical protein